MKTGHCGFQIRPLGVKTGQYRGWGGVLLPGPVVLICTEYCPNFRYWSLSMSWDCLCQIPENIERKRPRAFSLPKRPTTQKSSLVFSTWPARGSHWQSKATRTAKPRWSTKRRSHPSRSRNSNRSPGRNRPPRPHDELSRTPFPCWNYHSPDLRDTDLRFILSYDLGRLSWRPHLFWPQEPH